MYLYIEKFLVKFFNKMILFGFFLIFLYLNFCLFVNKFINVNLLIVILGNSFIII